MIAYTPPPSVVAGLIGLEGLYLLCVGPWRDRFRRSRAVSPWRRIGFSSGIVIGLIALASPLETLADNYLFSAHMLQHLLLTLGVAPLLMVGTPPWLARDLLYAIRLADFVRWARHPLIAFFGFNLIFALAHLPVVYELTLHSEPLHALEHVIFIVTALSMWLPVLSPVREIAPRYPALGQVLYLFLQTLPASLVGALLSATSAAYYPTYMAAPRVTPLSAVDDQQWGGLLMWVGGDVYFLIATGIVFFIWAAREESANRRPVGAHQ